MTKTIKLKIEGMSCNNCILSLSEILDSYSETVDVRRIKIGEAVVVTTEHGNIESLKKLIQSKSSYIVN